jgi:alginate O-acetyltransferase complex protein AlgI
MLFNSWQFLVFFLVVTISYFGLPPRSRWVLLVAASFWFYMSFFPAYGLILAGSTVVNYFAARAIEASAGRRRKALFVAGLAANVGVLAFFKYYNFLNENLAYVLGLTGAADPLPVLKILLPVGLSFYTFQAMSYLIEVHRGHHPAERHFGILALYVTYYPTLLAGPIGRPGHLLPQLHAAHAFDAQRVADGLKRMLWGLFLKVVIADRLAPFVNQVFDHPDQYEGLPLAVATFFFAFQVYADFAGYSDIAIGASQVMGIQLMTNFRRPYFARTVGEFWKRWHISLSTWLRDYLMLPISYSFMRWAERRGVLRGAEEYGGYVAGVMGAFLLGGLWHGARWTFVVWGALNGLYLIGEWTAHRAWLRLRMRRWPKPVRRAAAPLRLPLTFGLTCLAWIFFRADSTSDALRIIGHMASGLAESLRHLGEREYLKANVLLGQGSSDFVIASLAVAALLAVQWAQERAEARGGDLLVWLAARPVALRWAAYYALLTAVLFYGAFNRSRQFIYFQF